MTQTKTATKVVDPFADQPVIVDMKNIVKRFGTVEALRAAAGR